MVLGWALFVERLGTSGIFTAIIMSIIAVELYCMCVKRNWVIKMPDVVPPGVFRSFTCSDPNICHCVCGDDHQWIISLH